MCAVQLKDMKRTEHLVLNETMDQLANASYVHLYGNVLRREDGHVLRRALDFEGGDSGVDMEEVG